MDANKKVEPIPEHFANAQEAGEFWDTHSAADYWDEMEEIEMEFAIQERVFLIPVTDHIYHQIKQKAKGEGRPVVELVNDLLTREFA